MDKKSKDRKALLDMLKNLIITLIMVWMVFTFFIGVKMAPNEDMEPRISAGDILVYYRLDKEPSLRETMILNKNNTVYVGRVVAVPGDKVEISKEENLVVNGDTIMETRIYGKTPRYEGFTEYPLELGQDEYFVLADKREGGEDSRYYGAVRKSEFKGTVIGMFRRSEI